MIKTDFKTIDEYISSFPEDVQEILKKIRKIIISKVPEAEESISYGMPSIYMNGSYLIYFAGWKNHISLYPVSSNNKTLQDKLSPYLSGKGTVKFPLKKPIPYDLVAEIVRFKVQENAEKKSMK